MRLERGALLQLGAAVLLLGGGWPVTKAALLSGASAASFGLGRVTLSMVATGAVLAVAGRWRLPGRADLPALLALGLLQFGGYFLFAHLAIGLVPAGRTAVLSNATLIWTVPIALLLTGEAVDRRRAVAAALSAAGVVVLCGPWAIDWASPGAVAGHGFLLAAALCWAVAMAVVRLYPPRLGTLQLMPWSFALAALVMLPLAVLRGAGEWRPGAALALGAVGLVMSPLGAWCVIQAAQRLPLVVASVGFLAGPALGLLLSVLLLDEAMTLPLAAGTALLLGSAGLAATGGTRAREGAA